jgi:hypothetical protein
VLLKAIVARVNPDFQPDVPYSQEILITHHERITSYDETKLELDCTKGDKGKGDMIVRACHADDGEGVVPKTTSCASETCGRRGDGKALTPIIVFSSGETWDPEWSPHIVSDDLKDKDGNPLSWRYQCNDKRSMTEDFCVAYMRDIMWPAM